MKVIFMGTPEFAVPSLKEISDVYEVALVVTQPDKGKGRGKKLTPSPVKEEALKRNLPVLQPVKLREDHETIDSMRALAPDFIVVVAYGQILSEEVLAIPTYGCINLHASLLPKLRGAAPLNFALIEGHEETGATTMLMDKGLDTGDMLLKEKLSIREDMTVEHLHDTLSALGGTLLLRTMRGLQEGTITPVKQENHEATYAPLITKELQNIPWEKSALEVHNLVRGLSPVPGSFSYLDGKKIKILSTRVEEVAGGNPGDLLQVTKEGILVATGKGAVRILSLQAPGKKALSVKDFLNGNTIQAKRFERSDQGCL